MDRYTDGGRQKGFQIQGRKIGLSQGTPCKEAVQAWGRGLMVGTEQGLARVGCCWQTAQSQPPPAQKPCWVPLYLAGLLGEARCGLGVLWGVSTIVPTWHIVAGH